MTGRKYIFAFAVISDHPYLEADIEGVDGRKNGMQGDPVAPQVCDGSTQMNCRRVTSKLG